MQSWTGSQYLFWTIPKLFKGTAVALCLLRGELSDTSGFLRPMPYKHQSLACSTQPTLALLSGIFSPSVCERDLLSGEVSFKHPATTGGNFLHEWLFTVRSKAEQNLY